MSVKITHDQKETALEAIRARGTIKAGAEAAGVNPKTLRNEMRRSAIYARKVADALADGKGELGDRGVVGIEEIAFGDHKDIRAKLTARIALANAFVPGFRGTSRVEGKIEHDVRVVTAVPRPKYEIVEATEVKVIEAPKLLLPKPKKPKNVITAEDKAKLRELNRGKPVTLRDKLESH